MTDVSLNRITKTYNNGTLTAVDAVSFEVEKGELFGLIGPDGAGKTSIFRILTTLLLPDSGTAIVDGHDVITGYEAIRRKVGYMPGRFSLYQDLTVEENLRFFANLFGTTIEANDYLIRDIYTQIEPFKHRAAGKLSGGMKQKLALCCALIHKPTVLFLDEPTTGVDPVSRKEFWEMLRRLKEQNITILVSTPYMDEARLCDRIALIQNGKIISIDTPQGILEKFDAPLLAVKSHSMIRLLYDIRAWSHTENGYAFGEYHHLIPAGLPVNDELFSRLRHYLSERGHQDIVITPVAPTIEDCFIRLTSNTHSQIA